MQQISKLHAAARYYAAAGIKVFPCVPGGKQPATLNGFKDASIDLSQIDRWWSENQNYNLAMCPADANLFVVDVDPGADLASLLSKLPKTYTVKTPRGGYHFYFEGKGKSSVGKLAPHVDTRSEGGYVLVPPSVVNGNAYTIDQKIPYEPVPAWVGDAISTTAVVAKASVSEEDLPGNIASAIKRLKYYVENEDVAVEGCGGDDRTYRLCAEMFDFGLSPETTKDLIMENWIPYCQPSDTRTEFMLDACLEHALKYRQNEVGAYGVRPGEEAFAEAIKNLQLAPQKKSRFYFKDESEVDAEPDPNWIVKDLISERSTVMVYGAPGSYKSFLVLDIALAVATGRMTFGSETKPGLVFYGALEGQVHLKKARRAWRLARSMEGKIENFFVGNAPMIVLQEEIQEFGDQIRAKCGDRKPSIIIIDTLSKSMAGMNENDAQDANKFIKFCDSLVEEFGCTIIAIHHTGKDADRGARGSSAFLGGFDTMIEVKAHKETKVASVYVRRQKSTEEREAPWLFEGHVTGPSLTFDLITAEQHRLLVGESKDISPKTVGGALKGLNAFGEEAGVTTAVLATQLTPTKENESVEDRAAAIARTSRALSAAASKSLEAYTTKRGRATVWLLPAPTQS